MTLPKISVITVSYNHAEFIRQTIESVLWQRYENFEHIVIDGGSTDRTVEILKSYPHLNWVSEPDKGQSHALNKGFAKATGDIIAWINSDDWYTPGTFHEMVKELETYPIVMGGCDLTDKYGVTKQIVANEERNWFDTLKYWVYFSSPSQPSIFFKRELLKEIVQYKDGVLDEDLDFAMDWDLWLRIQKKYPLAKRSSKIFSCYRTYDTNKTGETMASVYREMSRVFRRHANEAVKPEQNFSFIFPISKSDSLPTEYLDSLNKQILPNVETIFVDCAEDKSESRKIRKALISLEDQFKRLTFRYHKELKAPSFFDAVDIGIRIAKSPFAAFIPHAKRIPEHFCLQISQAFESDSLGFIVPQLESCFGSQVSLVENTPQGIEFSSLMLNPKELSSFVVRTVAWQEVCDGLEVNKSQAGACKGFKRPLLFLLHKGWQAAISTVIGLEENLEVTKMTSQNSLFHVYMLAQLVDDTWSDVNTTPFANLRARNGFAIVFSEPRRQIAKALLTRAPKEWHALNDTTPVSELDRIIQAYPEFSPALYLRSQRSDSQADSARLLERWNMLYQKECEIFGIRTPVLQSPNIPSERIHGSV